MDPQLLIVMLILAVTVTLIVTERFRIDVVAILAMLSLVWTGSITPEEARSGFASNAVLAIMGVMIMGRGLERAGVTEKIASFILAISGSSKRRIISTVSLTAGTMSGFMQNIGAAALFLPVLTGISEREKISVSSLLMPMGFSALLGGTLTMVGTSSLIVLNDLLTQQGAESFGLFAVTPIGITLLVVGILYFFIFGGFVLPREPIHKEGASRPSAQRLLDVWGISSRLYTFRIPGDSSLIGQTVEEVEMGSEFNVNLLRIFDEDESENKIWDAIRFEPQQKIIVQGRKRDVEYFQETFGLDLEEEEKRSLEDARTGYLEVVIPARSNLVGETIRDVALRETYNAQVVLYFSDSEVVDTGLADREIKAGDTLVLQGQRDNLQHFMDSEDFIDVTPLEVESKRPEKALLAAGFFVGAIVMVMALDMPISMGFLTGALAMILSGVVSIEEAYRAIEWKVIFLISGLIPIGIAMETSGAASFIAENLVILTQGMPAYVLLLMLGFLTTAFSLFMSNVAATVLMVPLVLQLTGLGLDPRLMVLQVGLCAANSFLIPTHHVNALLMTPGGYRVADYLKAGSILSVIFVFVSTSMLFFFYQ